MKAFLAVDFPQSLTQKIIKQTSVIRRDYPDFNWVPEENFHITLYYIGEIDATKVNKIIKKVEIAIFDVEPTHLFSFGADLFIHKTIVPYIGFHKNSTIMNLHVRLAELFDADNTKKYKPHLTVARAKIPSKQQYFHLKKKLQNLKIEVDFPVTEVYLYESISKPKNPEYTKLHKFVLNKG